MTGFVELTARSAFSFLSGASTPEALAGRAVEVEMPALALTDRFDQGGAVRFERVCEGKNLRPIHGAEVVVGGEAAVSGRGALFGRGRRAGYGPGPAGAAGGWKLVLLCEDPEGWSNLAGLVTEGRHSAPRGEPRLESLATLRGRTSGLLCLWRPPVRGPRHTYVPPFSPPSLSSSPPARCRPTSAAGHEPMLAMLTRLFPERLWLALEHHGLPEEERLVVQWMEWAEDAGVPWVPVNAPRYARPEDRVVHDVLTCIRHDTTLGEAGNRLLPNGEWYLKSEEQMRLRWCERRRRHGPVKASRRGSCTPSRPSDAQGVPRCEPFGRRGRDPAGAELRGGSSPQQRGEREERPGRSCECRGCRALRRTGEIAGRCRFRITDLEPELPVFPTPGNQSSDVFLRALVLEGGRERYGRELGPGHWQQIDHELDVISRLDLADYFLVMWDIVRFANRRGILVQGRGSAANSAVCYCLGITAVDPVGMDLLFERFLSEERDEPPDIDLDIAHEDREEVLQYVYERYGREHAAMVCETITYRGKMAVRDAARVLGFSTDVADRLSVQADRGEAAEAAKRLADGGAEQAGLDPEERRTRALIRAVRGLHRLPRHRSIHVGGFVLTKRPVGEVVPVEPAAMEGRTVIQWDKDDLDRAGLVKLDLLGLGMLTALGEGIRHVREQRGVSLELADLPQGDPETYDMICEADTVGVFQIESRAQMNTLPRVKPRCFYDLAIEVALIRPGPIQGDMVHPYLRRRKGEEPVSYLDPRLEPVLERTLGVPLFQEQGMKVAVTLAGFTPAQADRLRRAMGFKRSERAMSRVGKELEEGLEANGVPPEVREKIFRQLTAFANYGFPESHALSFALLVYASAYLKCHYAPEFYCALLNAQPMGFYAPSTLIHDARRHGVEVRPVDLARSDWDCTLEPGERPFSRGGLEPRHERLARSEETPQGAKPLRRLRSGRGRRSECGAPDAAPALRIGLRMVRGLGGRARERLESAREEGPFTSVEDVVHRSGLGLAELRTLAEAGAFDTLWPGRREALWELLRGHRGDAGPLAPRPRAGEGSPGEDAPRRSGRPRGERGGGGMDSVRDELSRLPPMTRAEQVLADYRTVGLSVEGHPMEFLREKLRREGVITTEEVWGESAGAEVEVAGVAICRQRPRTARGVMFVTLEDETGLANFVVMPDLQERYREDLFGVPLLRLQGEVEREGEVVNVRVRRARALDLRKTGGRIGAAGGTGTDGRGETIGGSDPVHEPTSYPERLPQRDFR